MTGKAAATVPSTLAPIDEGSATASMGQDPGRVRAAGARYAGTFKTQTPDQRRGDEENHRRDEEALAFAEGGCEVRFGLEGYSARRR